MRVLILGGTRFVGRHIVQEALARGHAVTLFNRGKSNADLFPQVEKLTGDRDGDLDALKGKTWDVVIDVNGYVPRIVRQSVEALRDAVEHYVFISTISVYADLSQPGADEGAALHVLEDESVEEIGGETYGGLKVLCENVVEELMPGRAVMIRPGLVVGAYDHTNRFWYWVVRSAEGGEMLAPAPPETLMQVIDARDLAGFTLDMAEKRATGAYNACGQSHKLVDVLETGKQVSGSDTRFIWVDAAFLLENGMQPWSDLPLWIPADIIPESAGNHQVSRQKAVDAGLTFHSLNDTMRYCFEWERTREDEVNHSFTREHEAELLQKWHEEKE